ncbi:MAG: CapA family protein [Elainella sp.]
MSQDNLVDHTETLELARQGNPQAIAALIQQALITRGIQVRAACQNYCLHVVLAGETVPDRRTYARVVYAAVLCLGVATLHTLQVYGRQRGVKQPAWVQAFRLDETAQFQREEEQAVETAALLGVPMVAPARIGTNPSDSARAKPTRAKPIGPVTEARRVSSQRLTRLRSALHVSLPKSIDLPLAVSLGAAGLGLTAGLMLLKHVQTGKSVAEPTAPIPASAAPASTAGLPAAPASAPSSAPSSPAASPTANPAANPGPAANFSPSPTASPSPANPITDVAVTIKAVGDMIPGSNYRGKASLPTEPGEALAAEREFLFGNIKPFFDDNDLLFGNFESTLTDYPTSAKDTSQNMTFAFRTPPVYAQMLQELGFDVLSVANNHSMDFGDPGFEDTIAHIEQAGMKAVGKKDQIVYKTVKGVPMAFIGFSYLPYHNQMQDLERAGALVREAKQQAKIVVISVHAGAEGSDATHVSDRTEYFFGEDRGNLVAFAHAMVDQGADLILGHGPHVPRALELYKGKLIAYSLGNFVGYKTLSTVGTLGDSLILKAQLNAEGDFVSGRIIPVALDSNGVPKLDDYFQSVVLIRNLIRTDFPQTPITVDDMGYVIRTDR